MKKRNRRKGVLSGSRMSLLTERLSDFKIGGHPAIGVHSG
jgi:hypothetical protein